MKKLFSTTFNGYDIFTYLWNNKLCWVAIQIINSFNYLNPSKTISDCINREHFSRGIDYDVLEKDNLRRFKVNLNLNTTDFRYAPKLVIFYESGLFGFLNYSEKPEATPFKCLVRQEILPSIIRNGYYVTSDFKENSSSSETNISSQKVVSFTINYFLIP